MRGDALKGSIYQSFSTPGTERLVIYGITSHLVKLYIVNLYSLPYYIAEYKCLGQVLLK